MKRGYHKVIGTGGIGTGEIYRLEGHHTLGREESRSGHLLDNRDFCKLHIILHYISVLTENIKPEVQVIPVSAIGDDVRGNKVRDEMAKAGMNLKYIKTYTNIPTLHSLCFQYPDGSGGNITENQSACSKVDHSLLKAAECEIDSNSILLAAPEVPLQSRIEFIKIGALHKAFVVASFTSSEISGLEHSAVLENIDLLSINKDEACMLSGLANDVATLEVIKSCIIKLKKFNPDIKLTVTDGVNGVYAFENENLDFSPVYPVKAINTAGAGDAFLAGIIIGILKGHSIIRDAGSKSLHYATALASMSVTSKDTIHFGISNESLQEFISFHSDKL